MRATDAAICAPATLTKVKVAWPPLAHNLVVVPPSLQAPVSRPKLLIGGGNELTGTLAPRFNRKDPECQSAGAMVQRRLKYHGYVVPPAGAAPCMD